MHRLAGGQAPIRRRRLPPSLPFLSFLFSRSRSSLGEHANNTQECAQPNRSAGEEGLSSLLFFTCNLRVYVRAVRVRGVVREVRLFHSSLHAAQAFQGEFAVCRWACVQILVFLVQCPLTMAGLKIIAVAILLLAPLCT